MASMGRACLPVGCGSTRPLPMLRLRYVSVVQCGVNCFSNPSRVPTSARQPHRRRAGVGVTQRRLVTKASSSNGAGAVQQESPSSEHDSVPQPKLFQDVPALNGGPVLQVPAKRSLDEPEAKAAKPHLDLPVINGIPVLAVPMKPGDAPQSSAHGAIPARSVFNAPAWGTFSAAQPRMRGSPKGPNRLRLFSGTANEALAQEVACCLGTELSGVKVKRFADGEIYEQIQESIRGCDVFLIQPTCPPVNDHLMELLIMIDACKRASARSITAVLPYFGYARADRINQGREAIAAKLVANLITEAGANRVLAIDLHSGQCVGYFDIPVDHVYGDQVILDYLASKRISSGDLVVVSPDVGGVARARAFAKKLNDAPLAIVDKRRSAHNTSQVMNLIGDVDGKIAVLVDDMIDTAGTITNAAKQLHREGAREVYACATHAVFSPPADERLSSGVFQEVIVTNTIPIAPHVAQRIPQLTVLSVANLLGETIWRVYNSCSVQSMF